MHFMRTFCSFLLLMAVSASMAFGQNKVDEKGRKQGPWKKMAPDGKTVIYEGKFIDDKPEGKFTYYYPNGKVKIVTVFSQKGSVSRTKLFSEENGKLMAEGKYVSEKRDSTWRFYNDSLLASEENYVLGQKNGLEKTFYPNGKVAEEKPYKMGVLEGVWKQYYDDGAMKSQGKYVAGQMEGKALFYYPEGKTSVSGTYVHSLKEGTWTFYRPDGQVERTEVYKMGVMQGEPVLIKAEELDKMKNDPKLQQGDQEMQKQMVPH
jgi:antitoxin component YwqK of YwqJK toxin-antitoxin module